MLVRYSDWKRPTDDAFAFELRALPKSPTVPPIATRTDIRELAARALTDEAAARFAGKVSRWTGPEDEIDGAKPYAVEQLWFEETPWANRLSVSTLERVLRGVVLVLRAPGNGPVDFVMRDHHTVDAVLYHYATTGGLPRALFHADRHSDWCNDATLAARTPQQAATWWALLEGMKRPGAEREPVLRERDVVFTTAQPEGVEGEKNIGASKRIPGCVDPDAVAWPRALEDPRVTEGIDWVSLDLDFFQPARQLRLSGGLIRDERFASMMRRARVRLFVVSPQFLAGGDRIERWTTHGSLHSTARLLNLLRRG